MKFTEKRAVSDILDTFIGHTIQMHSKKKERDISCHDIQDFDPSPARMS